MNIAIVSEISAMDKNDAIVEALLPMKEKGHIIINAGMTKTQTATELTYIDTGLISALLLNSGRADLVVGGCGTGQGFLNAVVQYPGVFCGLIESPLDAWLFSQINGGNCISLALNKGFGWAGDVNLKFVFERFFSVESGCGYPPHRSESQKKSRGILASISQATHLSFPEILRKLDPSLVKRVLTFPGIKETLQIETLKDAVLKETLTELYAQ